jgi:hypothetical protein
MDVYGALRELYAEKRKLDSAITSLEASLRASTRGPAKRRGRKSMGAEERALVAERMRKYWEAKRMAAKQAPSLNGSSPSDGHLGGASSPPATVA